MSSHEDGQLPAPHSVSPADDAPAGGDVLADVSTETAELQAFARNVLDLKVGEQISHDTIQQGLTSLVKLYAVNYQTGRRHPPFVQGCAMPPTSALIMVSEMLRAVDVELFEVAMWQAWSGTERPVSRIG